jgi:hypothetical protein
MASKDNPIPQKAVVESETKALKAIYLHGLIRKGDKMKQGFAVLVLLTACFFLVPTAFAERIMLDEKVCYHDLNYFRGNEAIFSALNEGTQTADFKFIIPIVKNQLFGLRYTKYLQLSYSVQNGQTDPFATGNYHECKLGCLPEYEYAPYGEKYTNVCVDKICPEGPVTGKPNFCDFSKSNNIYYSHQAWFCQTVPRVLMICGEGGKCTPTNDGLHCLGYSTTSSFYNGTEYAIIAPKTPDGQFMVAAYQNGKVVAKKSISNMSASDYVANYGPIQSSQAHSFAQSTGLATMVASIQRTGATAVASRSTGSSASTRGINYSIVVTPTAPAKNKASPSNYRASSTTSNTSPYWQPVTTTTYKPATTKTTISTYKPMASTTTKKTTAATSSTSSAKRISSTTTKRTTTYRTTATTTASATTTAKKRYR